MSWKFLKGEYFGDNLISKGLKRDLAYMIYLILITYLTNHRHGISSIPGEFLYFQVSTLDFLDWDFSPVKIELPTGALREGINRSKT